MFFCNENRFLETCLVTYQNKINHDNLNWILDYYSKLPLRAQIWKMINNFLCEIRRNKYCLNEYLWCLN